jgi:hypothetical protein
MALTIPVPKPEQPADRIATAGRFTSKGICRVYPWHIPEWLGKHMSGISLTYTRHTTKWLGKHMSGISLTYSRHTPDIRPNDSEKICQTYFEIYLVYDTVCHIPGISQNMYDILHNCSYPRYIPRISNFYRFQMIPTTWMYLIEKFDKLEYEGSTVSPIKMIRDAKN